MKSKIWHKVVLSLMILYDVSLHWFRFLGIEDKHPLFPYFPILGLQYEIFWSLYWSIAFIISLWILFGKNKKIK